MPATTPAALCKKVAVIAFEGITPFHLSVPCLVFGSRVVDTDAMSFAITVCAPQAGRQ
jgi:hypothetical protein